MHKKLEEHATAAAAVRCSRRRSHRGKPRAASRWTIVTIAVIDIVFSLDSVITAVGMVEQIWVMVVAMVIAMGVMLVLRRADRPTSWRSTRPSRCWP